eukprot:Pgem_evm1s18360
MIPLRAQAVVDLVLLPQPTPLSAINKFLDITCLSDTICDSFIPNKKAHCPMLAFLLMNPGIKTKEFDKSNCGYNCCTVSSLGKISAMKCQYSTFHLPDRTRTSFV